MVETALALPICLLVLLGIFEYGRFCMVRNVLTNAAREGARFAIVHTNDKITSDVQAVVLNYLANQQSQVTSYATSVYSADVNGNAIAGVSWNNTAFGGNIGVQIDGDYHPLLTTFLGMPSTAHITAVAIMNCEGN